MNDIICIVSLCQGQGYVGEPGTLHQSNSVGNSLSAIAGKRCTVASCIAIVNYSNFFVEFFFRLKCFYGYIEFTHFQSLILLSDFGKKYFQGKTDKKILCFVSEFLAQILKNSEFLLECTEWILFKT